MLYAQTPVIPPAVKEKLSQPLDFDNPDRAAADLNRRRLLVKRACPEALSNLLIAQHRDKLRYAHIRSGNYAPKRFKFEVGDFVYMQQVNISNTLQPRARPAIYRVKEVRPSGRMMLQGKCGSIVDRHMSQCAPCHMPGIDPTLQPSLLDTPPEVACEVCSSVLATKEKMMLLCDHCDSGWHALCLDPPLVAVPEGHWLCPRCVTDGVTAVQLHARVTEHKPWQHIDEGPNLYPDKQMRQRDTAAKQLHGRLMVQNFIDPVTKSLRPYWGRVRYCGPERRPRYFDVQFDNGDVYDYTATELKAYLQSVGVTLPPGVTLPYDSQSLLGRAAHPERCHGCHWPQAMQLQGPASA
jgi:hypothetical protein